MLAQSRLFDDLEGFNPTLYPTSGDFRFAPQELYVSSPYDMQRQRLTFLVLFMSIAWLSIANFALPKY